MSGVGITSAIRMAETTRVVSILANQLDAHPELINTPTGIVDLRTGAVKPHDRWPAAVANHRSRSRPRATTSTLGQFLADTFQGDTEAH